MFVIRCIPPEVLGHLNCHQVKFYNLFLKSVFLCPTLLKLFQESETALLASDREVRCTCVNSNWQKPQSNYLFKIFLQFLF